MPTSNQTTRATPAGKRRPRRRRLVERTLPGLLDVMEHALYAEELARADGLLQRLDPRVKLVGLLALIIVAALARSLLVILGLFLIALTLARCSRVPIRTLAVRVWVGALMFTGLIALPAIFVTSGRVVARLPLLGWPVTAQGLRSAAYLVARGETAATLALLLVLCTPWPHVLKALRVLRLPVLLVVILGMSYRYILLMLGVARDMLESRQSRRVGALAGRDRRRLAAASVGVLLDKSFHLSSEVYLAMQSRGFGGEVYTIDEFRMQRRDWAGLAGFAALAALGFWLGR